MLKKLICFSICIFLFQCSSNNKDIVIEEVDYPDLIQKNYNHYIYKNGRMFLEASIELGKTYENKKEIVCTGINAYVYNSKNDLTTVIKSTTGIINSKKSELIFSENVIIEKKDDEVTLKTESLTLNYETNNMTTKKKVIISKSDGSILIADGMNSKLDDQLSEFVNMDLNYYYKDDENDEK